MKRLVFLFVLCVSSLVLFAEELKWTLPYQANTVLLDDSLIQYSVIFGYSEHSETERELKTKDEEITAFLFYFMLTKTKIDFESSNLSNLEKEMLQEINDTILTSGEIKIIKIISPTGNESAYGYKNFKWGMTVEDVKEECPDIEQTDMLYNGWQAPAYILLCWCVNVGISEASRVPNPLDYETNEIEAFRSKEQGLAFYFVGGKLRYVHIRLVGYDVYSELAKKYGNANRVIKQTSDNTYYIAVWCDKGRIIVLQEDIFGSEIFGYVDSEWLYPLIDKAMSDYRSSKKKSVIRMKQIID